MFRLLMVLFCLIMLLTISFSWVRSWFAVDTVSVMHSGMRLTQVRHACGVITISDMQGQWVFPVASAQIEIRSTATRTMHSYGCEDGFEVNYADFPAFEFEYGDELFSVSLPHWLLIIVFGILPTIHLFALANRRNKPFCKCGYDLRGTLAAKHTMCPECGSQIRYRHIKQAPAV